MRDTDVADLATAVRSAADYRPDPDRPPVELRLPFRGPWVTVRTPSERVPSHGTHFGGQTFAFDFVAVDPRRRTASVRDWRTFLATEPVDRFVGFGMPVLAPVDSRVVAVHDGEPDHVARRSPLLLIPYALTQGARLQEGVHAITGNHVMLELEGQAVYILLAHLRRGSVGVAPGDRVRAGAQVGSCGNSGNSTQPHLHVQAMDSSFLPDSRGLSVVFLEYALRHADGADRVSRGIPRRREVVEPVSS